MGEFDPTTGIITQYTLPTPKSGPEGIALGPDGNLWFTEFGVPDDGDAIGWINSVEWDDRPAGGEHR